MKSNGLNLNFDRFSDANFEQLAEAIVNNMVANPTIFVTPNPDVVALQAGKSDYSTKLLNAANRGRKEVAEKNAARLVLDGLLKQLGTYVLNIANGNHVILTLSGFPMRKPNETRYIKVPETITISNGIPSGSLISSIEKDLAVKVYEHQYTDNLQGENTVWTSKSTSQSKYTHEGLTAGKQYWFRVCVKGSRGQNACSPVISRFVQ